MNLPLHGLGFGVWNAILLRLNTWHFVLLPTASLRAVFVAGQIGNSV